METTVFGSSRTLWGRVGHYGITSVAVHLLANPAIQEFFEANLTLISYPYEEIRDTDFEERIREAGEAGAFIPLANVPDEIWKKLPKEKNPEWGRVGGRDTSGGRRSSGPEHPNHYADIDVAPVGSTVNWRDLCLADASLIWPDEWQTKFYGQLLHKVSQNDRGLLPFRVWQLFDAMVDSLNADDVDGFLTAAGVCAHYVGDACQPLHGSTMSNGDPSRQVQRWLPEKKEWDTVDFGAGSHSAYESFMVSSNVNALIDGISAELPLDGHRLELSADGRDAARATLQLMRDVADLLPPLTIINCYQAARSHYEENRDTLTEKEAIAVPMWNELGSRTISAMVAGARALAMVWESAWTAANRPNLAAVMLEPEALKARYTDTGFIPSKELHEIAPLLRQPNAD